MMNPDLHQLHPYPFEKLARLKAGIQPPDSLSHIALSIGEPKHAPPQFVLETLSNNLNRLSNYPATNGLPELRQAIAGWAERRFKLPDQALDPNTQVLPVNGTREALFAFAQTIIDRTQPNPLVVSPNPFYQIYEGAARLAGASLALLDCTADNGYIPDFSKVSPATWQHCQLLYLCSPGNPTGAVLTLEHWRTLLALADEHDFVIASDECYSELYFDEAKPPIGLLQACHALGRNDFSRCVVFHSLSKRSNLPGLRSGFAAGDASVLAEFLRYRTYHGCAMPVPSQLASIAAWADEGHVIHNRSLYQQKFATVLNVLDGCLNVTQPEAGFYLWPNTPVNGETFARELFAQQHITVLPGTYLGRASDGRNPGEHHVRMALVASPEECIEAARRLKTFMTQF